MEHVIEFYLKENIDDNIKIKKWPNKNFLPIFLREKYSFYEIRLLNRTCLLLETKSEDSGIKILQKQLKNIEALTNLQVILYYKDISRYKRKKLIMNRISFVIENGQMYIPFIGLDIKNKSGNLKEVKKSFSTTTQIAYLYFLYNKDVLINTTEFSELFNLTLMTSSRALQDLYNANLIKYKLGGKTGRSKIYKRASDPDYFNRGKDYIKSPIKKIVYVKNVPNGSVVAGLESLAEFSMINPPGYLIRAISVLQLNNMNEEIINKNDDRILDDKLVELQVWEYDPKIFMKNGYVDLMSLYATLKDLNEDRIEMAIDKVLSKEEWFTV